MQKILVSIFLMCVAPLALSQGRGVQYIYYNPNGNPCNSSTYPVTVYIPSGALYTCQNGSVAAASGSGSFVTLSGDATSTSTGGATEVVGLLNHLLPSLTTGYLNWTGSAWALSAGGSGDTITSPNSTLNVGGSSSATTLDLAGSAGEIMAGATPALTYTPTFGKSGTAGTLALFPATGNFTTTLGTAATASNTFLFPAAVFTNGHVGYCAVTSTTCTWTDAGYAYNSIPLSDLATQAANTVLANVTSGSAVPTAASIPAGVQFYTSGTGYSAATSANLLGVCTTCVVASAPGAGVAHFAGSTQTATSSAVTSSDATGNTSGSGNFVLVTSPTLVTPVLGAATATSLLATGIVDGQAPITITTGTTANLGATYNSGYTFNQEATAGTGVTYTLPATATGKQYCVANSGTTGVVNTGVLTVYPPSSSYIIYKGVVNTVGGGGTHGIASGGAAGDSACFIAIDATHWLVLSGSGVWTEN